MSYVGLLDTLPSTQPLPRQPIPGITPGLCFLGDPTPMPGIRLTTYSSAQQQLVRAGLRLHRSGWPLVGHLRVVLSAESTAGCIPRKREPVAQGPCPFGPSLSARFGLSVLTTVQKHIRVPTHSDLAHRCFPLGSVATCFAPLASHMLWGVKPQHEGGAITSTPLGWELDDSPHPHVHPVIKGRVRLCLSSS